MDDAYLPEHLKNSSEVEGYQRIANQFRDRGDTVIWGPDGPYVELNGGFRYDVSMAFMYPSVINFKNVVK